MNILIVEDHQIVIDGLRTLLAGEKSIAGIYEALSGEQALEILAGQAISLVLLDINLPGMNGFEVCRQLKSLKEGPKVIALTMHSNAGYISRMVKAGVDGYLLKNTGKEELLLAIRKVSAGEQYFSREAANNLISGMQQPRQPRTSDYIQKLTRREKEVLHLIIDEHTTEEIAEKLFISPATAISHRKSLLRKLNAKNTAGLVKAAFEFGLVG
ncbi:MAG: response regulator transcription factor [Lewinellaceae bacterium]|nr:response regulator transcription factor [Phaeodactylibacter sp.]MCB9035714.1 response regulator transcription factor [Lewinellaceae bacterium]